MSEDRHGVSWTMEDYQQLVGRLRAGHDDERLARESGRSLASIRQIARRMLPRDGKKPRSNLAALRDALSDPDYEWQRHLEAAYEAEGKPLWSEGSDLRMRQAYTNGSPRLPDLARELRVTEDQAARRMIERGIVPSTIALVEQLGCTPGGQVEMRYRVAVDDRSCSVSTLVVTDTEGAVLAAEAWVAPHDFDRRLDELGQEFPGARWIIVTRLLGETEGDEHRGVFRDDDPFMDEPPVDPWGDAEPVADIGPEDEEFWGLPPIEQEQPSSPYPAPNYDADPWS